MKKVIPLVFLTAIFLAACGSSGQEASPVDQQIYNQALQSNNPDLCKPIENSALKEECKEAIEGNNILFLALENTDLQTCGKIKNKQIKESCDIQVAAKIEEQKKAEELKAKTAEEEKKTAEYEKNLDLEGCEKIELEHLRLQCIVNVSTEFARSKHDDKYCNEITDESLKENCKTLANQ